MGRERTLNERVEGVRRALESIEIGIDAYHEGKLQGWQQVVIQLYKLLLDKESGPLVSVTFPDLALHPMTVEVPKPNPGDILFFMLGRVHLSPRMFSVELFDETKLRIPLSDWLQQILFVLDSREYSIARFIRILRHSEAAHFGVKTGQDVEATRAIRIIQSGITQSNAEAYTVALGDYVLKQLKERLLLFEAGR